MAGSVHGLCVALALVGLWIGLGCCLLELDAGELSWALLFVGSGLEFLGFLGLVDWAGLWMRDLG